MQRLESKTISCSRPGSDVSSPGGGSAPSGGGSVSSGGSSGKSGWKLTMRTMLVGLLIGTTGLAHAQPGGRPQRPVTRPTPTPAPSDAKDTAPQQGTPTQDAETEEEKPFRRLPPRAKVTFNLEGANLQELVRLISDMTGKRFIIPGKIRDIEATVYAPTKVTAAEAYQAFLSVLAINGLTVVPSGRYLKVVETAGIEGETLSTYTSGNGTGEDRYVTQLMRLDNVAANDASELLEKFKTKDGSISAYAPTNMLIVTDTGRNIRRMMKIVRAIDVARSGEKLWVEPIHYAEAVALAETIQEIFPPEESADSGTSPGNGRAATRRRPNRRPNRNNDEGGGEVVGSADSGPRLTKVFADERTNSLVIIASESAYLRVLELIKQFDVPIEGEGRIRVHFLQHGDSEEIAATLQTLITGSSSGSTGRTTPSRGNAGASGGGGSVSASSGGDDSLFEGSVRVTAHPSSNALVITSSLHDYAALRRVIDRLDSPRRQVFIEAVIMEVSIKRDRNLGLSYHGGIPGIPSDGSLTVLGLSREGLSSLAPASAASLQGLAAGAFGPVEETSAQIIGTSIPSFGVLINALATSRDANVLSTPHIIALDNTEAEISIGQNVPLQTSGIPGGLLGGLGGLGGLQGQQGLGQLGGQLGGLAGGFGGNVQRQDVGTTLRITPHIGDAGNVRLEIEEEISEVEGSLTGVGSLGVVPFNRREARTQVSVKDQETVVIGGLMHDVMSEQETKIPLLGDIPLLGMLFRSRSKTKEKRNLILILTPYIVRDQSDMRAIFQRKMRERQEFIDRYLVFNNNDYTPPLDYSRTRGLVAEVNQKMRAMQEDYLLQKAEEGEESKTHRPRPPVETSPGLSEGDITIEPDGAEAEQVEIEVGSTPSASTTATSTSTTTTSTLPTSTVPALTGPTAARREAAPRREEPARGVPPGSEFRPRPRVRDAEGDETSDDGGNDDGGSIDAQDFARDLPAEEGDLSSGAGDEDSADTAEEDE